MTSVGRVLFETALDEQLKARGLKRKGESAVREAPFDESAYSEDVSHREEKLGHQIERISQRIDALSENCASIDELSGAVQSMMKTSAAYAQEVNERLKKIESRLSG